jgi:hypothetical protein
MHGNILGCQPHKHQAHYATAELETAEVHLKVSLAVGISVSAAKVLLATGYCMLRRYL